MSAESRAKVSAALRLRVYTPEMCAVKSAAAKACGSGKWMLGRGGEKAPSWRGDSVGYGGLHIWVRKELGLANQCEDCGLSKIPEGKQRYFGWANISHEYKRELSDWKQLCVKCHMAYDAQHRKVKQQLSA